MIHGEPAAYARRILLAVTGLSPQVITETIWALAQRVPAFIPNELHVLTTAEGANRMRLMLLTPGSHGAGTAFATLAHELNLPAIAELLVHRHLHVLRSSDGHPLCDILNERDNMTAADAIAGLIRDLTADPAAALHVSIAGGRKTMGIFAGFAVSLFGRPQDRLSHVLVPEPFQSHPQFFFPSREPRVLFTRDNRPVSTAEATVVLADIPFLRLREVIAPTELVGSAGFAGAVQRLQRRFDPPWLIFDLRDGTIRAHGELVRLTPNLAGFLLWLAQLRRAGRDLDWRTADPRELTRAIAAFPNAHAAVSAAEQALRKGFDFDYVAEKKARINKLVEAAVGPAASLYGVETVGHRPASRYQLATPPECITIIPATNHGGPVEHA